MQAARNKKQSIVLLRCKAYEPQQSPASYHQWCLPYGSLNKKEFRSGTINLTKPMAGEIIGPRGKPTIAILPTQCNFCFLNTYLCTCKYGLHIPSKNLLFAADWDYYWDSQLIKMQNSPTPIGTSTMKFLQLRVKGKYGRGGRKSVRTRGPRCLLLDSILWTCQGNCTH